MKILEVKNISKSFSYASKKHEVLKDIDFFVEVGEAVGIVGGSGCGKSTLAKVITCLEKPDKGEVIFKEKYIHSLKKSRLKDIYQHMQMIFQEPAESFNPRIKLGKSIIDTMINFGISKKDAKKQFITLLEKCGLSEKLINKYPHEVSGGQCQRAAIARAISIKPSLLICDEATSALDVTVQKHILELLEKLKDSGMSIIFISHDIALVQQLCSRIIVMNDGKIVEEGKSSDIINEPQDPYTKALIDAVIF